MAAAYDLFGTGKTAIKTTFGKYLEAAFTGRAYASGNPTSRIIQSVNRAWTDANDNWTTDCDLLNGNAQDLRTSGGDFCGAFSNRNFGTTTFSNTIDPSILHGWGVRPSDWNLGALGPARSAAAHVGRGRLLLALVPGLPRDRQSRHLPC